MFLENNEISIVIQINGKKRAILKSKKGIEQKTLLESAKQDNIVKKYLKDKEIIKIIYIQDKLINILTND